MSKYNKVAKPKLQTQAEHLVYEAKQTFQLASLDFIDKLNEVDGKKKTRVIDRVNWLVDTTTEFNDTCANMLRDLRGVTRELSLDVGRATRVLDEEQKLIKQKHDVCQESWTCLMFM